MSYSNQCTYFIILRKKSKGYEILYNIGSESNITTVLRLNGKYARKIFTDIVEALAKQGAVVPSRITETEQVYTIREDLGPVIGAYLILIRRARNIEKWTTFLQRLLDGDYAGVAKAFSSFLEIAIELSKSIRNEKHRAYTLSPIVVDALSSALKRFINKLVRAY